MTRLSVAVVGLRGIAQGHARGFAALDTDFRLAAGCDLDPKAAEAFAGAFPGVKVYAGYSRMLSEEKPDVVVIATNNVSHAPLALEAVSAGARGIFLEKPMAVNLKDARRIVAACGERKCTLVVNHQRRTYPVFQVMRRMIEEGAVGKPELLRGGCAGDVLSDGTHTVDTLRHLAGDIEVKRVFAQICRDEPDPAEPRGMGYDARGGYRYGHPVETGAMAVIEFANGLRAEMFTGSAQPRGRAYQDFEVTGSHGTLWRAGDSAKVPLAIRDRSGGDWREVPVPPADQVRTSSTLENYRLFGRAVRGEAVQHPLSGESGLKDQEVVMAIYESARLRARIELPLSQDLFPLDLILSERG